MPLIRGTGRRLLRRWSVPAFLALGTLAPAPTGPDYPRSQVGRFEVDGLDFRPDGAWRPGTDRVRTRRRALLGRGQLARLNSPGLSASRVAGAFTVPVIPIAFANVAAPFPAASYHQVLFATTPAPLPYSVRTYYAEASRGAVTIDGVVFGWVTADSSDLYYEDGCNGIGVLSACPHGARPLGELLLGALARSDTGSTDWGLFDNDGADGQPNSGDDDGIVDFVTFLQPEVDGACGTTNLWAHRYDVGAWSSGGYVTRSPRRDAQGLAIPGQFVRVRDYTLQSAVGGPDACTAGQLMPVGTVSHETGHAFGLPDLYDTNLRSPAVTQGIGEWGIMGSGNYTQPYSPAGFDAWSLAELGWVAVDTVPTGGTVTVPPLASGDTVLALMVTGTDEYFLFENRQPIGSDTAQLNPACTFRTRSCAKAPGLLLWHVDAGQVAAHGFRQGNAVNVGAVHGVALVQADGLNQLRQPGSRNRGDGGDPWPGSSGATRFDELTSPAAVDNQGRSAGFALDSIRQLAAGGTIAFRLTRTTPGTVLLTLAQASDALVRRGTLTPVQVALLDSLGNGNGRYDSGDFLAWYRQQLFTAAQQGRAP
ncbi:MAG: M6 family metalloprotease domain-containing protein [Gemmatimonadetes bacterium]|nr:M6 family metalloprotease domain-containing protein [Gemmatimonadota bacterium]